LDWGNRIRPRLAWIQGPGKELSFVPCEVVGIKLGSCVTCYYCHKCGASTHLSSQVETSERKNEALPHFVPIDLHFPIVRWELR